MITKVIKDNLVATINTDEGVEATLSLEETKYSKFMSNRRDQGYGLYTYFLASQELDFLLGHTKEAIELSEDIEVFELLQKACESKLKIALDYTGVDLLQVPMEQSFEICKVKSKITGQEFSLKFSVMTRIPLYPLGFIPSAFVKDFNPDTQHVNESYDDFIFPYILDTKKTAQRTVILHTDFEKARGLHKNGDILQGYYPQYLVAGALVTPMVSCGDFCVSRLR